MAQFKGMINVVGTDGRPSTFTYDVLDGATVGIYLNVDPNREADTNSPEMFYPDRDMYIVDIVAGDAAQTGMIELISNGHKTGIMINLASHYPTSSGRPALRIPLSCGKQYAWQAVNTIT